MRCIKPRCELPRTNQKWRSVHSGGFRLGGETKLQGCWIKCVCSRIRRVRGTNSTLRTTVCETSTLKRNTVSIRGPIDGSGPPLPPFPLPVSKPIVCNRRHLGASQRHCRQSYPDTPDRRNTRRKSNYTTLELSWTPLGRHQPSRKIFHRLSYWNIWRTGEDSNPRPPDS